MPNMESLLPYASKVMVKVKLRGGGGGTTDTERQAKI